MRNPRLNIVGCALLAVLLVGCSDQARQSEVVATPRGTPAVPGGATVHNSDEAIRAVAARAYQAAFDAYLGVNDDIATRVRTAITPSDKRGAYADLAMGKSRFVDALRGIQFPADMASDAATLVRVGTEEELLERAAADPSSDGTVLEQAGSTWDHTLAVANVVALDLGLKGTPLETPARNAAPPRAATASIRNVRLYGAKADGKTDDTAAIQAAIDDAPARAEIVYLPVGTYVVSQINLPSGATLLGESRTGTVIQASGRSATTLDYSNCIVYSASTRNVTVMNLTVRGRGAPTPTDGEILIGLSEVANATVRGVTLDHASGRALFATGPGSTRGVYDDILVTNVYHARVTSVFNERLNKMIPTPPYGTGLFLYDGYSDNQVSYLTTDTTSATGLYFDGGSSIGPFAYNERNAFSDIHIYRANQVSPGWPAVLVKGARYNTFDHFRIEDSTVDATNAINLIREQQGLLTANNTFSNGVVKKIGGQVLNLQSASSNTFRDIDAYEIGQGYTSQLIGIGWTPMNAGVSGGPSSDNTFERIRLVRQVDHTYYANGVLFDTRQEAMQRNRFVGIDWEAPTSSVIGTIGQHGAPLVGPDANTFENVSILPCAFDPVKDKECVNGSFHVTSPIPTGGTVTLAVRVRNVGETSSPALTLSLFGDVQSFSVYPPDYLQFVKCSGCQFQSLYGDSAYVFEWAPLAPAETRSLIVTMKATGPPGEYSWRLGLNTGPISESGPAAGPSVPGQYRIAGWMGQTIIQTR